MSRMQADDRTWDKAVACVMVEFADAWDALSGYTKEEREKDARKRQYEKEMLQAKLERRSR